MKRHLDEDLKSTKMTKVIEKEVEANTDRIDGVFIAGNKATLDKNAGMYILHPSPPPRVE